MSNKPDWELWYKNAMRIVQWAHADAVRVVALEKEAQATDDPVAKQAKVDEALRIASVLCRKLEANVHPDPEPY